MSKIKLVYIAGPYRGDVARNIDAARRAALNVAGLSPLVYPVTPHLNSAHFEQNLDRTDRYWLDATLASLESWL